MRQEKKDWRDMFMRKIRAKVFESNSSSVHSLTFSNEGQEKNRLPMKDGYIITDYGQFGREYNVYYNQASKLSYLVTLIYFAFETDYEDCDEIYQSRYFALLDDAVCKYTGAKGIRILAKEEPYIDHQSFPEWGCIDFINMYDENEIINFIFNKYVGLKTYSD